LSAAELAARWLRKAKRYQAAAGRIAARRAQVAAELAEAEALLERARAASTASELGVVEGATGPARIAAARGRAADRLPYRTFRSSAGTPILVGRSARDNDALTVKVARGNDVWLHARDIKGAHVVM